MTTTLSRVRELLPEVAKRAPDIDATRELPGDLLDGLRAAGCLRMAVPAGYGGDALALPELLAVVEALATADGSVAWSVGQVALSQLIIGCGPAELSATVYAAGPDVYAAGAVAPKGRATRTGTGDGWRISGQWPFVTGLTRAAWVYLNCVLVDGRTVRTGPDGVPRTRIMLVPAAEVTVVDTWHTLGLRGTASHDALVTAVDCPAGRGLDLVPGEPATDRAAAGIASSSLIIAAVATGIAAAAVQDLVELATGGKRPALSATRLAASPVFQDQLGEAEALVPAARALLAAQAHECWAAVTGQGRMSVAQRARTRAAATTVTALATRVVDLAYTLAGGSAVYDTAPLQRRLRDAHTATQHFISGRGSYATLGAILVGEHTEQGPL